MAGVFDCAECGMRVEARTFHPHVYCLLVKAGERNPEAYMATTMPLLEEHFDRLAEAEALAHQARREATRSGRSPE